MPCPFQRSSSAATMEHAAVTTDTTMTAPSDVSSAPLEMPSSSNVSFFPSLQDTMIKYDSIFPRCFTGAKVSFTKLLSNNLQVNLSVGHCISDCNPSI